MTAYPSPHPRPAASLHQLLSDQQAYFDSGATREYGFRAEQLRRLRDVLKQNEARINAAMSADLRKPPFEVYASEIGFLYTEIAHTLKHLKSWMKDRRVGTPLPIMPARSQIRSEPRGRVLMIGPWNYPLQLILAPLIGAMAAGNVAVLKPSELAPATSALVADLISRTFDSRYIAVVEGGAEATQALLAHRWDYIFFTGSAPVGRIVARAAAEHLTPVTLELGGKSPCIVLPDADLDLAARRIVWGKCFNAGQTCVAPDYLLVHRSVREPLLEQMVQQIRSCYGEDPAASPDYARIINERHLDRLATLLGGANVATGGQIDRAQRYLAPTILDGVTPDHPAMAGEIFGPILPVLAFETLDEAVAIVRQHPNPLALYLFTRSKADEERILRALPFGGGCVNDTMVHFTSANLPFGGVGESGMGAYHGRRSFELFSHEKGIVRSGGWLDPRVRYAPYAGKLGFLRKLLS